MESKYEIRVLRDKLALSNELDEGSTKNLIMVGSLHLISSR